MDTLPNEILRMILNGSAPPDNDDETPLRAWRAGGRSRRCRPFLDPRWRFAARAVCRLWRDTIEHPTVGEATVLHKWRGKTQRRPAIEVRRTHSLLCPRWAAGKFVCTSAVAEWVAAGTGPWGDEPDGVRAWCRDYAGASRKQVMAALVASDAAWAVKHALDVEWAEAHFSVDDRRVVVAHMGSGEYDYWDDDACGDEQGLEEALWQVAIRWGSHATLLAIAACRSPLQYVRATTHDALARACRAGRTRLVADLVADGAPVDAKCWASAARARDVSCFEVLLDLAPPLCDGRAPLPPPTVSDGAHDEQVPVYGQWFYEAISAGRWRILALCDARGIAYDARAAFMLAARARRTKVLAWLWHRMREGRDDVDDIDDSNGASAADNRRQQRTCSIDLRKAAKHAVGHHNRRRARSADTIAWLCEVAGYVPDTQADMMHLIAGACVSHCVPCALYVLERWPRRVLAIGAPTLGTLFRACLCDGVASAGRFLHVVHTHGPALGVDAIDRIGLWSALASPTVCGTYTPPTGSSPPPGPARTHWHANRRWIDTPCTVAAMRVAYDMAHGRQVRAADVAQIDTMARILSVPPCACTKEPAADNRGVPRDAEETYGNTEKDSERGAERQSNDTANAIVDDGRCRAANDSDNRVARDGATDEDVPCTDGATLAALAPLAVWCRPQPVSVDALFPGWRARANATPSGSLHALTRDALCRRTVLWLESVQLVADADRTS